MNKQYLWAVGGAFVVISGVIVIKRLLHKKDIDFSIFDSPDIPNSGKCMDKKLIKMLQKLEKQTNIPIFKLINSGARSPSWNAKVGGVRNSAHLIPKCQAVDIKTTSMTMRNKLVIAAKSIGFKRIGVGKTFVHLDIDPSKTQNVAWGYPSGTKPPINPFT